MERDLKYGMVSAIEDELQDNLKPTLQSIIAAGIKVWMLTGDKTLTAMNIAKSAGLSKPGSVFLKFTADDLKAEIETLSRNTKIGDASKLQHEALKYLLDKAIKTQTSGMPRAVSAEYYDMLSKIYKIARNDRAISLPSNILSKPQKFDYEAPFTLVLDTDVFKLLMQYKLQFKFFHIAFACQSVVCCRLSP